MKRQNTKLDRVSIYSKLVKEGFTLSTLLKFSNPQLRTLCSKILNEVVTTDSQERKYKLDVEPEAEAFIKDVTAKTQELKPENISIVDNIGTVTTEMTEDEELTPNNEPIIDYDKDGKQQTLLGSGEVNEFEMYETIMYGGAGDFDATSFYNPEAGGFSTSQGPMDSYYSTNNKGTLIGAGTDQDEGQYTGNAKYLDTPSFNNPDDRGFDSGGARDSYAGNDYDEGGFAGELNELGGAPEPIFSFRNPYEGGKKLEPSKGSRGYSKGLYEDDIDKTYDVDTIHPGEGEATQTPTQQQAPDGMGDTGPDEKGSRGMGMEETITKKELMEKAKDDNNPWAICTSKLGLTGRKKDTYTDKEEKDFEACIMGVKKSTGYQKESIDKEIVENWLMGLVEKYERPFMSKGQLLQTINEIASMDAPAPAKTPTRIKPGIKPGRPKRKNPYKPHPGPNPRPKAIDNDVEDAKHELPSWLDFDSLFINHKEYA